MPAPGLRPRVIALRSAPAVRSGTVSLESGGLRTWVGAAWGAVGLGHFFVPGVPLPELGDWKPLAHCVWKWGPSPLLPGAVVPLRPGWCARPPRMGVGSGQGRRPGEGPFSEPGASPPRWMGTWYPPPPSPEWVWASRWEGEPRGVCRPLSLRSARLWPGAAG